MAHRGLSQEAENGWPGNHPAGDADIGGGPRVVETDGGERAARLLASTPGLQQFRQRLCWAASGRSLGLGKGLGRAGIGAQSASGKR